MLRLRLGLASMAEDMIVMLVLICILLPLRYLIAHLVPGDVFGSVGIISAVLFSMVYLSRTGRLGGFGRIFWRRVSKVSSGRRQILAFLTIGLNLYIMASLILGITYGGDYLDSAVILQQVEPITPDEQAALDSISTSLGERDLAGISEQLREIYGDVSGTEWIISFLGIFLMPFLDFPSWAVLVMLTDNFLHGHLLNFAIVFFVESLETAAVLIYVKIVNRSDRAAGLDGAIPPKGADGTNRRL